MRVKTIVDEDFTNYKKPAMFIGTISCGGKCCIEAGIPLSVCQNDGWRASAPISIDDEQLCLRYLNNPLTESIVFGGLEPLEQFDELCSFLEVLRGQFQCKDDVVIYTGYYFEEVPEWIQQLATYGNVIVKFGRYIPNQKHIFDEVLGIIGGATGAVEIEVKDEPIDFSKVEIEPLFKDYVDFETFSKSDFRAVKVKSCEAVKKSKKLLKFTLDDGSGTDRVILSGIHDYYEPEELVGKTCVAITNLPPRPMMGIASEGMLISAVHHENGEEKLHLLMLDPHIPAGAKMY